MKLKSITAVFFTALIMTFSLSAQEAPRPRRADSPTMTGVERTRSPREHNQDQIITISGKVSVTKQGIMSIETKDGNVYVLTTSRRSNNSEETKDIISMIKIRNGKAIIVSGVLNDDSHVFTVLKIGGMSSDDTGK